LHFQLGFSCGAIVTLEIFAASVANFRQLEAAPIISAIGEGRSSSKCPTGKSGQAGNFAVCRVLISVFPKIFRFAITPNQIYIHRIPSH
jgi:hypothetical protein